MTGHDGDDVTQDAVAVKNEVAYHIHGFVASAFVVETQTAGADVLVALDDDGVVKGTTLDEPLIQQGLHVLVEAECAGG